MWPYYAYGCVPPLLRIHLSVVVPNLYLLRANNQQSYSGRLARVHIVFGGQMLHFDTRSSSIEGIDAGSVVALCLYTRQYIFYVSLIRIDIHICRLWPDDSF